MGIPLSRGHAQLLGEVDGATQMAAPGSVRETRSDPAEARGWHRQLLRNESTIWRAPRNFPLRSWAREPAVGTPSKSSVWLGLVASENLKSPIGSTFHIASFIFSCPRGLLVAKKR